MSIAGGVEKAPERGEQATCEIIQIFTKNNNQWNEPEISDTAAVAFKEAMATHQLKTAFAHDSYLINLGSPDKKLYQKSLAAFVKEHRRSEQLGLMGVVFHPGAHVGSGEEEAIERIADAINECHRQTLRLKTLTLLENAAGQGTTIGYCFEHLETILKKVRNKKRVGVCFDTQHAFAAGYDLSTEQGYEAVFKEFDRVVGLQWLRAFHLNDSKKPFGSRVDRHEHIGQGEIGETAFRCLVNDQRFQNLPGSLETPKSPDLHEDIENLSRLRSYQQD